MLRRIGIIFAIILGCAALGALAVFGLIRSWAPPEVWGKPPLYTGAQRVEVQDFGKFGKIDEKAHALADAVHIMKIIKFTVAAKPEEIRSYYERAFGQGGMEPDDWGRITDEPKELNYSWTSKGRSPSVYFIDLVVKEESTNQSVIEIGVSMFPGY